MEEYFLKNSTTGLWYCGNWGDLMRPQFKYAEDMDLAGAWEVAQSSPPSDSVTLYKMVDGVLREADFHGRLLFD